MRGKQIVVVGSTNTDMVVETPQLPAPGQTVLGGSFRVTPGGKGANQAVAALRAGARTTFITALGDDAFGTESRQRLAHEGIDLSYVAVKAGVPSGVALILVDAHGENLIAVAPGANGQLASADILHAEAAFLQAEMVILQLEIPLDTAITVAETAARHGCPVLLNPAPMPPDGLPEALLRHVDILTPNAGELRGVAPEANDLATAARAVLARGPRMLVVTQGRQGAAIFTADSDFTMPAFAVTAVDTVGAGDCFSACLGVALAEGQALPAAVRFASAAAALSTTRPGAQASMPTRAAIEELVQQAG